MVTLRLSYSTFTSVTPLLEMCATCVIGRIQVCSETQHSWRAWTAGYDVYVIHHVISYIMICHIKSHTWMSICDLTHFKSHLYDVTHFKSHICDLTYFESHTYVTWLILSHIYVTWLISSHISMTWCISHHMYVTWLISSHIYVMWIVSNPIYPSTRVKSHIPIHVCTLTHLRVGHDLTQRIRVYNMPDSCAWCGVWHDWYSATSAIERPKP